MDGSLLGNVSGVIFFLLFQVNGFILADVFLVHERRGVKWFFGSVFGSFLLHWMPTVVSLFIGFSAVSNVAALGCTFGLGILATMYGIHRDQAVQKDGARPVQEPFSLPGFARQNWPVLLMALAVIGYGALLATHTIPEVDGALHAGQSTYGDMNMHLGFITSIARQGVFPPEYSILPGTMLAYPFLCDSISSSIYVFGASLRLSYMLPMLFAAAQVFGGIYLLAERWLKSRAKAALVWFVFTFSGGLGVYYFTPLAGEESIALSEMLSGFYLTPTNLVDHNIRWVNTICDMLIPQRASLFGWAMLFPILYLLYRAVYEQEKRYFLYAGVLAGGLPMIHTHSFLALGLVCAGWLLMSLIQRYREWKPDSFLEKYAYGVRIGVLIVIAGLFILFGYQSAAGNGLQDNVYFAVCIAGLLVFAGVLFWQLAAAFRRGDGRQLFETWGRLLLIVIVLALPQLVTWTFQQSAAEGFVRGHFNWSNESDSYVLFYLKNMGVVAVLAAVGLVRASREQFRVAAPAVLIWFIAELVVFQPNVYDNNKLLFVGYVFILGLCADVVIDWLKKIRVKAAACVLLILFLCLSGVSGGMTMAREAVSDYELYSKGYTEAARFVEAATPVQATFLTANNHNNAIASLTGRNIVCGAGTFLFYHGLDYSEQEQAVNQMFQNPQASAQLFADYHVNYVVVGSYERAIEGIDTEWFEQNLRKVYENQEVSVYEYAAYLPGEA